MSERKGITENECNFQGAVVGDPSFFDVGNGEGAFFKIKTYVPRQDANGQWVEEVKIVPILNLNPTKTANTIKPYIKDGKRVKVRAYFDSWEDPPGTEQTGLIMTRVSLGSGPFVPRNDKSAIPNLPQV